MNNLGADPIGQSVSTWKVQPLKFDRAGPHKDMVMVRDLVSGSFDISRLHL